MTTATRKVLALCVSLAYLPLVALLIGSADNSIAIAVQVGIALLFGATFAYLLPSKWRIGVAIVGFVSIAFPFFVLFLVGMPIYKTVTAAWEALGESFLSQMTLHPFEVVAATFGPVGAATFASFGVSRKFLKQT